MARAPFLHRDGRAPVQSVTTAPESLEAEQSARIRRYLFTMGVRTTCFVLAVVTTGWVRWVAVVLAVVLPYVAVVLANAVRPRVSGGFRPVSPTEDPRRQVGRG